MDQLPQLVMEVVDEKKEYIYRESVLLKKSYVYSLYLSLYEKVCSQ